MPVMPSENSVTKPSVVMRPTLPSFWVNHRLPSGPGGDSRRLAGDAIRSELRQGAAVVMRPTRVEARLAEPQPAVGSDGDALGAAVGREEVLGQFARGRDLDRCWLRCAR